MSETRRTPSATVNPSSDLFDLLARWTDLNNLTVFDVLWFEICSQFVDMDDVMDRDVVEDAEIVLQRPVSILIGRCDGIVGTKQLVVFWYTCCIDNEDLDNLLSARPRNDIDAILWNVFAFDACIILLEATPSWTNAKCMQVKKGDRLLLLHLCPDLSFDIREEDCGLSVRCLLQLVFAKVLRLLAGTPVIWMQMVGCPPNNWKLRAGEVLVHQ